MAAAHLQQQLQDLHVDDVSVAAVVQLTDRIPQALQYLDRDTQGLLHEHHKDWKELYCLQNQRLYYVNNKAGYNSWDAPPCFQFQEWLLDSSLFGISVVEARRLYLALDALLLAAPPEQVQQSLGVLCKLVNNVVACNNTLPQYRALKTNNARLRQNIWDLPAAAEIVRLLGWVRQAPGAQADHHYQQQQQSEGGDGADVYVLPAGAPLGPLQAAAARLQRLKDAKGHSGTAEHVAPDGLGAGGSGRPASQYYNAPGFMYQQQIWHCSTCDRPINDGSERLWTGRADAPRGEYRFHCTSCSNPCFNLCETCWDAMTERGVPMHIPGHTFEHIGPRMTRHNDYYASSSSGEGGEGNAWGRRAVPIPARAMDRLKQRTGVSNWG